MECCLALCFLLGCCLGKGTNQQPPQPIVNVNMAPTTETVIHRPSPGYDYQYPTTPTPYRGQPQYNHGNGMTTARYWFVMVLAFIDYGTQQYLPFSARICDVGWRSSSNHMKRVLPHRMPARIEPMVETSKPSKIIHGPRLWIESNLCLSMKLKQVPLGFPYAAAIRL